MFSVSAFHRNGRTIFRRRSDRAVILIGVSGRWKRQPSGPFEVAQILDVQGLGRPLVDAQSAAVTAILAALLVGAMSPGPSFVMVARNAIALSRRDGLATAWGMGIGGVFFSAIALVGLYVGKLSGSSSSRTRLRLPLRRGC